MKKLKHFFAIVFMASVAFSCTTKDAEIPAEKPIDPSTVYEISDAAFGDYLIYNTTLSSSSANLLPYGVCFKKDGKYYIDKEIAKTVTTLSLVKNTSDITALTAAGFTETAATPIANIDGINLFINCTTLKLTSNKVTGTLDLSALTKLETLEMNFNLVTGFTLPASLVRFRYGAYTANANEVKLASIDLSGCPDINHIYLINHSIESGSFTLPATAANLKEIDMTGNPGASFPIPDALYDQLTTAKGVMKESDVTPVVDPYEITDVAFAEYLIYNCTNVDAANKLPAGLAWLDTGSGKYYIDKNIAKTATAVMVGKSSAEITPLTAAGVATASTKIANIDGIEFFTNCTSIKLTSNVLTGKLDVSMLDKLETLDMNSNYVNELIVPASLVTLNYNASTSGSAPQDRWLTAINLSACSNLNAITLTNHKIITAGFVLPTSYANLQKITMTGNTGAPFTIPADLFDQLTTAVGVQK